LPGWKRTLYVVWVVELLAISGFSVAYPFLPYYIQELGVTKQGEVELWSGIIIAVQGVTMTLVSPLWGSLADRYGRKPMLVRATLGGAVVLGAMAFVQNVQQLALLRAAQGALTGTVAAAMSLVAGTAPRERSGYALGLLQMAVWIGSSVGPLIGGLVADAWGYRAAFLVTGTLLLLSGLTVWRFVDEDFSPARQSRRKGDALEGLRLVLRARRLMALLAVRISTRLGSSLLAPILPLFIQSLVVDQTRVASTAGLVSGISAGASAISAIVLGRASDRYGYRPVLLVCAVAAAALWLPHYLVTATWQLVVLQTAVGFVMGGVLAAVSSSLANLAPEGRQGTVYGLDASATSAASAVAPMVGAGVAAGFGLRVPFLLTAGTLAVSSLLVWLFVPKIQEKADPATSD